MPNDLFKESTHSPDLIIAGWQLHWLERQSGFVFCPDNCVAEVEILNRLRLILSENGEPNRIPNPQWPIEEVQGDSSTHIF